MTKYIACVLHEVNLRLQNHAQNV